MSSPRHRQIFDTLHAEILEGKFNRDGKLPSEESLCRKWNVSRPTVARALRELQMQGLIERRAGSGTYLRAENRPLQTTIGLLMESLGKTEILDPICAEITRAAQQRGCSVFTGGLASGRSVDALASEWYAAGVRGVVFAPLEHPQAEREALNIQIVSAFRKAGLSVVLVDRDLLEFPRRSDCDLISMDSFHAGCELGAHVASTGASRTAFIAKPEYPATTDLRLNGLSAGLLRGGTNPPEFLVGDPEDVGFVKKICDSFDAIVCSNDLTATQLMQTAFGLGRHVPGDFRLAGFDDVSFAALLPVPLTTIRQPCRDIGAACVDTMIGRLRHPELPARTILLRGELVVRQSTAAASVARRVE
jgi:LacI family transcriptional regulator